MAYTFTETETFTIDSTFDSLYADSLADFESGTVSLMRVQLIVIKKQE